MKIKTLYRYCNAGEFPTNAQISYSSPARLLKHMIRLSKTIDYLTKNDYKDIYDLGTLLSIGVFRLKDNYSKYWDKWLKCIDKKG